jgi:hypothetical protein
MPTATLDDVQSVSPAPTGGTASVNDIAAVHGSVSQASGGTASPDDVLAVHGPATGGTASLADIAVVHAPQPTGRTTPFLTGPTGPTTISARTPSVWERIKNVFTEGIPAFDNTGKFEAAAHTDTGKLVSGETPRMQVITPEAAMTAGEREKHPVLTGTAEVVGGLTSPESAITIAGTGGLGEMGGIAGRIVPRLVSAGFSSQMIYGAYQQIPEVKKALEAGDYSTAKRLITKIALQGGLATLGLKHAATGKGAVTGKTGEVEETTSTEPEVRTTEPTSPLTEAVKEPVPEVRIADSTAAKSEMEAKNTQTVDKTRFRASDGSIRDVNTDQLEAAKKIDPGLEVVDRPTPKDIARTVSEDHIPVVSKDEVLSEAVTRMVANSKELQKIGVDPEKIESRGDVQKMLDDSAAHIQQNLDPRVGATITFDAQKQLATELNTTVEDLLARKSGQAYNAEQAIAARALVKDSQTRVMNLARIAAMGDEDYQAQFAKALAQHQEIVNTVKGAAAEAGRALGSFRINEADLPQLKITDAFAKLPTEALTKAAQLLSKIDPEDTRQVNKFIEQIKPASTLDKIFEYYRNALLSSPKTVTVKGASEVAMMALEATKKVVAAGISKVAGGEDQRFASESYWYAKGAAQAMQHTKAVLTGEFNLEDAPGFEGDGQQAIKGPVGNVVRFPGEVLKRQTNLMYVLNYFGELNAQAARLAIKEGLKGQELNARVEYLAHNPTPEMIDAANEMGLHNTFQNRLGKFGRTIQGGIRTEPSGIAKFLFPFFRTPVNLVKASGEFSPYGLFKAAVGGKELLGLGEKLTPDERLDLTSRGLVGSSIAAAIAYLALEGHVTGGGPVDFRKKQTLEATGWQPYSVKIGGKYFSYHRAEPLGLTMGLVADTVHGIKSGDSEDVTMSKKDTAITHIARNLDNFPFLTQVAALLSVMKGQQGTTVNNWIGRQLAGFVPALVSNVAEGIDPTVRHPDGIVQQIESHVPGLTQKVPAVRDIVGQPVQRPTSQLGGADPFPITTAKNDPVVNELARLGVSTPALPKAIKQGKKVVTLTDEESEKLAEWEGTQLYKRLSGAIKNQAWKNAPDQRKQAAIKEWNAEFRKALPYQLQKIRVNKSATSGLGPDAPTPSAGAVIGDPATIPGMIKPGNLDLNNRPIVKNADGTRSSEYSTSFADEQGHEVLVPTVVNGKFLTPDGKKPKEGSAEEKAMFKRAWQHYEKTGEHLGIFDTPEHADAYADVVHNRKQNTTTNQVAPTHRYDPDQKKIGPVE